MANFPEQATSLLLSLLVLSGVSAVAVDDDTTTSNNNNDHLECDLYIAESTIPNAGLGIFTAIERQPGDTVGEADICIPIIDLDWHHPETFYPFQEYGWAGEVMGMKFEAMTVDVEALCPGLDCAINCNLALINVDKATPNYDEAGLHRAKDPAAGSITPYHNGSTVVSRRIPAGGELYKFYGDSWFTTRQEVFGNIPLIKDYPAAERLLKAFNETAVNLESKARDNGNDKTIDFHSILFDELLMPLRSIWDSRTLNALPTTLEKVNLALEHDIGEVYQANATRTLEFLQSKGRCADHITWGYSTIQGAGRGAFAKRDIAKGTGITGSPIRYLPQKETMLEMYDYESHEDESAEAVIGKQQLVNYCFGHPETSVLLFPYGIGVNYINHSRDSNVKIQWAKHGSLNQDDTFFEMGPIELEEQPSHKLTLDYIATRDIKAGEELLMDYGEDWEKAWEEHKWAWKDTLNEEAETYVNAHEWNKLHADAIIKTSSEVLTDPYPDNLQIRCHVHLVDRKVASWKDPTKVWEWSVKDYGFPCNILERDDDITAGVSYSVELVSEPMHRWDHREVAKHEFTGVPRAAIRFFDTPRSTDMHLPTAFRQPIGLPSDMIPDAWKYDEGDDGVVYDEL